MKTLKQQHIRFILPSNPEPTIKSGQYTKGVWIVWFLIFWKESYVTMEIVIEKNTSTRQIYLNIKLPTKS